MNDVNFEEEVDLQMDGRAIHCCQFWLQQIQGTARGIINMYTIHQCNYRHQLLGANGLEDQGNIGHASIQ